MSERLTEALADLRSVHRTNGRQWQPECVTCVQTWPCLSAEAADIIATALAAQPDPEWPDRAWLISHWVGHRCEYVDCRATEQHEHGGGQPMREMTPEERAAFGGGHRMRPRFFFRPPSAEGSAEGPDPQEAP